MIMRNYKVLIYGKAGEKSLQMLWQEPPDWKKGDRRTALVWIHGGGWKTGCAGQFVRHMDYFSTRGVVGFSIQYRLQTEQVTIEDCLWDCRRAVRYIREHGEDLGIDPDQIIVAGDSAGGHLACCLGNPAIVGNPLERANLVINCNGVVDVTRRFKENLLGVPVETGSVIKWKEQYDRAYAISPLLRICKEHVPVMTVQGLLDQTVPPEDSVQFHDGLKDLGCDSTLLLLPDIGHACVLFDYRLENEKVYGILKQIEEYLQERKMLDGI